MGRLAGGQAGRQAQTRSRWRRRRQRGCQRRAARRGGAGDGAGWCGAVLDWAAGRGREGDKRESGRVSRAQRPATGWRVGVRLAGALVPTRGRADQTHRRLREGDGQAALAGACQQGGRCDAHHRRLINQLAPRASAARWPPSPVLRVLCRALRACERASERPNDRTTEPPSPRRPSSPVYPSARCPPARCPSSVARRPSPCRLLATTRSPVCLPTSPYLLPPSRPDGQRLPSALPSESSAHGDALLRDCLPAASSWSLLASPVLRSRPRPPCQLLLRDLAWPACPPAPCPWVPPARCPPLLLPLLPSPPHSQ